MSAWDTVITLCCILDIFAYGMGVGMVMRDRQAERRRKGREEWPVRLGPPSDYQ